MLWLEITEDGIELCWRAKRLTPTRNSPFSPLHNKEHKVIIIMGKLDMCMKVKIIKDIPKEYK